MLTQVHVICRLEYCCPLWNPSDIACIQTIESVQQHFTKRISSFQHLSYCDRLKGQEKGQEKGQRDKGTREGTRKGARGETSDKGRDKEAK